MKVANIGKNQPSILNVAAALRATATAELSYRLINRLADDISRDVQVLGSRPIIACLLIRGRQPVAQAVVTDCM